MVLVLLEALVLSHLSNTRGVSCLFNDVTFKVLYVLWWGDQQMVVSCESERYIRAQNVINKMTTLETDIKFQFSSSLCVIKTV